MPVSTRSVELTILHQLNA